MRHTLLAALTLFTAGAATAQTGPRVEVMAGGASLRLTEDERASTERGGGLGMEVGYGAGRSLGFFVRAARFRIDYEELASEERYALGQLDLGIRYGIRVPGVSLRPYAELAVSRARISDRVDSQDYVLAGGGLTAGIGAEYPLATHAALRLGVATTRGRFTSGRFGGVELEPDEDFTTGRVTLGVAWRP